jgi:CRP-like cAMP-binding protein
MTRWSTADELQATPLFSALPKRELRRMARSVETLILPAGRWLQAEGERVREFLVVSQGHVAVTAGARTIGYLLPGQWSDGSTLLHAGSARYGLATATPARVLSFGEREFVACLDTVPGLARRLLMASVVAA